MTSVMKQRDTYALGGNLQRDRLSVQGKSIKDGHQQKRFADGQFDRIYPRDKAIWLRINPQQAWQYETWDKEQQAVVTVIKMFLQTCKHYFARTKQTVVCSSGSHLDKPCYGHAIRREHFKKMKGIEERTGIKPKEESAVGVANQYSFAVVVCEEMIALPAIDKKTGLVRKSKQGNIILNHFPRPWVDPIQIAKETPRTFGRRMHLSIGKSHLMQFLQFDEEMKDYCAHCATGMQTAEIICPDCETRSELPDVVQFGEDMQQLRAQVFRCGACPYEGVMVPDLVCDGCGNPEEGRLTDFEFRLKSEKTGDKQSILKIVGVRKPLSTVKDAETRAKVQDMFDNPLDLLHIFRPTPIDDQRRIFGDLAANVDPRPPTKEDVEKADAEGYATQEDETADSEDEAA